MIQRSDNHAATTLWNLLGGANSVEAFDRLVPMPATTPHPAWGLTTTTAADNVRLLCDFAFPNATLTPATGPTGCGCWSTSCATSAGA